MNRPTFFVIGAHKAGTTSLCELLAQHPEIFVSEPKEPNFFTMNLNRGIAWYESLFQPGPECRAIGEGSTTYSLTGVFPECVDRIARYAPDAQIIYMVRHPLRRLESAWMQWRHDNVISVAERFDDALRQTPALLDSARYAVHVDRYRSCFGTANVLVIFFEDFCESPLHVVQHVYGFLGVDSSFVPRDVASARNEWKGKSQDRLLLQSIRSLPAYRWLTETFISDRVRQRLSQFLRAPISQRPEWDVESHRWVTTRLHAELERFLLAHGKDRHYWSLALAHDTTISVGPSA